jgi:hypothetical protein
MSNAFRTELAAAINRHSKENGSDTPDYILAEYLEHCLYVFDHAVHAREMWRRPTGNVLDNLSVLGNQSTYSNR